MSKADLPLSGQLKPVRKDGQGQGREAAQERVAEANALAEIDPVKDGYINAIQVYPYTQERPLSGLRRR